MSSDSDIIAAKSNIGKKDFERVVYWSESAKSHLIGRNFKKEKSASICLNVNLACSICIFVLFFFKFY